jgi:hypothetical protein
MANEGNKPLERAISFMMRLIISLILPAWGVVMIVLGATRGRLVDRDRRGGVRDRRGAVRGEFDCHAAARRPAPIVRTP